ncbi:MAG: NosD domain-containing protein [Candidatus Thorarchaeota archaeon]
MELDVRDESRVCRTPPGPRQDLHWHLRPRTRIMAVSLVFMLTTTGIVYIILPIPPPYIPPDQQQLTPHAAIAIYGDVEFSDTAQLEGWSGDGSPEDPYIIDGLEIDLGVENGPCINISNTRVSFIISNCNLTSDIGILLENVTNGELVNNTCNNNMFGIWIRFSGSNTVANNNCSNNVGTGIFLDSVINCDLVNNTCINNGENSIWLWWSNNNTIANNTCTSNCGHGIWLLWSNNNTIANNICDNNYVAADEEFGGGIYLCFSGSNSLFNNTCNDNTRYGLLIHYSNSNTIANNTCNNNTKWGLYISYSDSNTVEHNTCNSNDIGISLEESDSNTVTNNTCNSNDIGINIERSDYNTVANNTCNNNRIGIGLYALDTNLVVNNTCLGNTEHDIDGWYTTEEDGPGEDGTEEFNPVVLLLTGSVAAIIFLVGGWKQRMGG